MAGIKTLGFAVEDHDPRSWELYQFIADMDYENGDTFCFKAGGDGDNGELILSYLDEWFALADEIERKADEALDESAHSISEAVATSKLNECTVRNGIAYRIRKALGVCDG